MPYTNTWEPDGLYRKFTGHIYAEEILKSNLETHKHPNFHSIKYIINDFTAIDGHSINTNHIKVYATTDSIISHSKGTLKLAQVIADTNLMPLIDDYRNQMSNELFECEIFQDIETARRWIEDTTKTP